MSEESTSPTSPGSGKAQVYPKGDGLYYMDESGNEFVLLPIWTKKSITDSDSPYALLVTDGTIYIDASSAAVTVDLPAGVDARKGIYRFKCLDATNTVTITPNGAETIDGAASVTMALYDALALEWNGIEWSVL